MNYNTFNEDSSLVHLFLPSDKDSFSYHGFEKKKKKEYEIVRYINKQKPNRFILYYFDKNTHLLAIERLVKSIPLSKENYDYVPNH